MGLRDIQLSLQYFFEYFSKFTFRVENYNKKWFAIIIL